MIKKTICILSILGFAAFITLAQTPPPSAPKARIDLLEGRVVKVENGDTLTVQANGQNLYQVKLQAVDAPDSGQAYFKDSRKSLSKLVLNKVVKVVVHNTDSSGLLIGTVFRKGLDVGLTMLEKGMAWHLKRYAYQQTASSRKKYSDAQSAASTARTGLWAGDNPVSPEVFRGETVSPAAKVVEPRSNTQTIPANNERKYVLGPRGGCYYVAESGRKVYVQEKNLCGNPPPEIKP